MNRILVEYSWSIRYYFIDIQNYIKENRKKNILLINRIFHESGINNICIFIYIIIIRNYYNLTHWQAFLVQ